MESLEYQLGLYAATFTHALLALPLLAALYAIGEMVTESQQNRKRFCIRHLRSFLLWEVSFKQIGGIRFLKVGRFGCSFWFKRKK